MDKFWAPSIFDPSALIDRNWQSRFRDELSGADIEQFVPSEHEQEDGTILAVCSVLRDYSAVLLQYFLIQCL